MDTFVMILEVLALLPFAAGGLFVLVVALVAIGRLFTGWDGWLF